ncbi:MAG TPA: C40 family peptidase [Candidatus Tetragenococcus pullicola]|nr:C40 family peptidase [Candidatus Tetragenococcus pullicola]
MQKIVIASNTFLWKKPEKNTVLQKIIDRPLEELPKYLTAEDVMLLYKESLVDSEVLYGTVVEVLEETSLFNKVIVFDQPTHKFGKGYVGYILSKHLQSLPEHKAIGQQQVAVTAPTTSLFLKNKRRELTFGTTLPLEKVLEDQYYVWTPEGIGRVNKTKTQIIGDHPLENVAQNMIDLAKQFNKLAYIWAGISGLGFDCSGFVYSLHKTQGIIIPRDADDQALGGKRLPFEKALPGDLLFFAYEKGKGLIHHVGLYLGDDTMIHSQTPGSKVLITKLPGTKYEEELCTVSRYF